MPEPVMDAEQLSEFLFGHMPTARDVYRIEHAGADGVRMRVPVDERNVRPGGTVSGPTMMALADSAAWMVTIQHIGPVPLSVTSSLNISFLAKPELRDLLAHASLLRLGRRQSVSEVRLWSDGGTPDEPVAHAVVTYAIPAGR